MEIDSILSCPICIDSFENTIICPHCRQRFCSKCIDKWFEEKPSTTTLSSCPLCGKVTQRNEFIKLPWYDDLQKLFNDKNKCSQHTKEELCIHCSTCLDAAQYRLLKALADQEKIIQCDLDRLTQCIEYKKSIIGQILLRKQERLHELAQFQTKIRTEIYSQTLKILGKFEDEQNALKAEKANYETKKIELKKKIQSSNKMDLFINEKDFLEKISQRLKIPEIDEINLPDDIIRSSLTLPWQTCEFSVEQFSIKQRNNDRISTLPIRLEHNQYWKLIIYPNGEGHHKGIYLSVKLKLDKGISQSIDYNIIIELIHQDDRKHNHIFKTVESFKEGQSNGSDQFYQIKNLSTNGFLNSENDTIKFRVKLSPKSILEERQLLQWQITCFKQDRHVQNEEMKRELTHLRQKHTNDNRIVEDQRIKIQELERENSELKRKRRSESNDRYQDEDHRTHSNERIVIYAKEKRFKH